jgi:hypothetical protein
MTMRKRQLNQKQCPSRGPDADVETSLLTRGPRSTESSGPFWVKSTVLNVGQPLPVYPKAGLFRTTQDLALGPEADTSIQIDEALSARANATFQISLQRLPLYPSQEGFC